MSETYEHLYGNRNQLANVHNFYQGTARKALFVCSAGLLRSATAAHLFSAEPYNWNTRSAGVALEYALNPVNEAMLEWADVVYCMEPWHERRLKAIFGDRLAKYAEKVKTLGIPDSYAYRDPDLQEALRVAVEAMDAAERHEAETPAEDGV